MRDQIKTEQTKWMTAMQAGDVATMVKCAERLEKMQNVQRLLNRATATLAAVLMGGQ